MKEIGERLREARESIGISIDEVSEDLKLDQEQIINVENGNVDAFKDIFNLFSLILLIAITSKFLVRWR